MALDEARLRQQLQMARDARLRLAENGDEFGDRQLGFGEQGEKAQARRLAGSGQRVEHGVEGCVLRHGSLLQTRHLRLYMHISLYVKENLRVRPGPAGFCLGSATAER